MDEALDTKSLWHPAPHGLFLFKMPFAVSSFFW
jgi:hypothetical protein